jgi:hypothetical protein
MTDNELIAAGWRQDCDMWRHEDDPGIGYNRRSAALLAEGQAQPPDDPEPRPTCGTCPYWFDTHEKRYDESRTEIAYGICARLRRDGGSVGVEDWCGQHPDMAAWIETEWPKVKR